VAMHCSRLSPADVGRGGVVSTFSQHRWSRIGDDRAGPNERLFSKFEVQAPDCRSSNWCVTSLRRVTDWRVTADFAAASASLANLLEPRRGGSTVVLLPQCPPCTSTPDLRRACLRAAGFGAHAGRIMMLGACGETVIRPDRNVPRSDPDCAGFLLGSPPLKQLTDAADLL